jgi:hypothetical protein
MIAVGYISSRASPLTCRTVEIYNRAAAAVSYHKVGAVVVHMGSLVVALPTMPLATGEKKSYEIETRGGGVGVRMR